MKKTICFSVLFCLMLCVKSQTGLDPGFATGGIGLYNPMNRSQALATAVQADGKILVAGLGSTNPLTGPIVRLNPNGTPDASFNGTGTVLVPEMHTIESIAIQPDGKIVLAGIGFVSSISYNVYVIVRLNPDGSIDTGFGTNGVVYVDIVFGVDYGQALALQPDGKIVVAGNSQIPGTDFDISVVRLLGNGTLDNSFDGDGKLVIERPGTTEYESGLVVQPDGKILLEGKTYLNNDPDIMIVRLNNDGSYDNGFGANGFFFFEDVGSYEPYFGKTLTLQPDGKILVGRNTYTVGAYFVAFRVNPNGTLDNSFGNAGVVTVAFGTQEDICTSILVQPDGKIVLGGYSIQPAPNSSDFALARLNSDGSPDQCFNQTGMITIPRPGWDEAVDMALQADGKIIIVGYTEVPVISFMVMRIQSSGGTSQDSDGDGYNSCVDCDDNNPAIHPGATEVCNNIDDDCDGMIDEGVQLTFYRDLDSDGYGDPAAPFLACSLPAGYVTNNTDCNDNNSVIHPGATEVCNGIDDDCDGMIDENLLSTYYRDLDTDGYGDPGNSTQSCSPPAGYVTDNSDCNDNDPTIHPGALENSCNGIDNDCDGEIDEDTQQATYYFDGDGDGWGIASQTILACVLPAGYAVNPGDCNDDNPAIHPAATELCNGIDDDCDGQIDDGAIQTFFRDNDNDGFGNNAETVQGCSAPAGYVINGNDCNDNNASINPLAPEICNGIDDDCDGLPDDGLTQNLYYRDLDGDGYGAGIPVQACSPPAGYVIDGGDCNDEAPSIHPGAPEICNSLDDDCDGEIDEGLATAYYRDNDSDGYGDPNSSLMVCFQPAGFVTNNGDCNDLNPAINPAATEICNEKDDNCDGQIDEGFIKTTYYRDADSDGFGNGNDPLEACTQPIGYVANSSDCDDNNDTIHPNAPEYCNGIDENCNGIIDDNAVLVTWYRDADMDGWGDPNQTVQACTPPPGFIREAFDCNDASPGVHPGADEICNGVDDDCDGSVDEACGLDADGDGYTVEDGDCNDNDPAIHPGATEICNGVDDDCDGFIDEDVQQTFYQDLDGDGFGNPAVTILACTQPAGYVSDNTDCNDNPATGGGAIHPGALEVCNGVDDDCDGLIDEDVKLTFYQDLDGDGYGNPSVIVMACTTPPGYVSNSNDCNDDPATGGAAMHPGALEVCNGVDDDCDGLTDEDLQQAFYQDLDGDGYGNSSVSLSACSAPPGYVSNNTDCNDDPATGGAAIHPGALEVCNGVDDDCDGLTDEDVQQTFYQDLDGDGFGNSSVSLMACSAPPGYVGNNTDCNDDPATGGAAIQPGATEICGNGVDDNCNGQVDENTVVAAITPAGTVNLCSGTDLQLTATSGAGLSYQWFRNNSVLTGATGMTLTVSSSGNYSVRVTNSGNCSNISAVTIVNMVNPPRPGISVQGNGNSCPINLQAHPGGPVTYQWYINNLPIPGATQRNYSATTDGSYTVTVTRDGCPGTSPALDVTSCPQGLLSKGAAINEKSLHGPASFRLYPNPATDQFTIDLSLGADAVNEVTIQITTLTGTVLTSQKSFTVNGGLRQNIKLNPAWNDQIYLVRLITKENVFTEMLVIVKY